MIHNYDEENFENRVKEFFGILAQDQRLVFVTSIFGYQGDFQERAKNFRTIVRKYMPDQFVFTDGLELLNCPSYISADLIHPSLEGIRKITDTWCEVMKSYLNR